MPSCDHTGTPRHFHSSTTSGSACLISARTRASISPRQSLSSLIRASIKREGDAVLVAAVFFTAFFILLGAFKLFVAIDHDRKSYLPILAICGTGAQLQPPSGSPSQI